jgi:GTP-binding protein
VTSEVPIAADFSAGEALFGRPWRFLCGAPNLEALPAADRPEVAFAGRSNVGKSSLINALVRRRGLARTSDTPGRTRELNFFTAEGVPLYLVDMPGYGYAKAPRTKIESWTALVRAYLRGRPTLMRVYLLIDARHGLKPPDFELMSLLDEAAVSYQGVLTKSDKPKPSVLDEVRVATSNELQSHAAAHPEVVVTSARTGLGMRELRAAVAGLLASHTPSHT